MFDVGAFVYPMGLDPFGHLLDDIFDHPTPSDDPHFGGAHGHQDDDPMVFCGDPDADAADWTSQHGETCAVVAQLSLIEHLTGVDYSEADLVRVAYDHGWYTPGEGTQPNDMEELLVYAGIPCRNVTDQSLLDLYDAIERGEHVLVALDANEIWNPEMGAELRDLGHAVWVTGMSFREDGTLCIVLNDSGRPDGAEFEVSGEDFVNAWGDFECRAVITEITEGVGHA